MRSTPLTIGGVIAAVGIVATLYGLYANQQKESRAREADVEKANLRLLEDDRLTQDMLNRLDSLELLTNNTKTDSQALKTQLRSELDQLSERVAEDEKIDSNHRLTVFTDAVKALDNRISLNERGVRENTAQINRTDDEAHKNTQDHVNQKQRANTREGDRKVRDGKIATNSRDIAYNSGRIDALEDVTGNNEDIVTLKTEIKHIREGQDRLVSWRDSLQISSVEILERQMEIMQAEISALKAAANAGN